MIYFTNLKNFDVEMRIKKISKFLYTQSSRNNFHLKENFVLRLSVVMLIKGY